MNIDENNITFEIDKNKIVRNYNDYKSIANIYYPLKTNSNDIILKTLNESFDSYDGFLLSNINHFNKLNSIGVSPDKMCFINVLSGYDTTKYLYSMGVRFFVFDDFDSLKTFISYAKLDECKIGIRLNTYEIFNDSFIHLGCTRNEVKKMLNLINNKCYVGITFYLQTSIKNRTDAISKMLDYIVDSFNNYNLNFISIAGIRNIKSLNVNKINDVKTSLNLNEIILEPGEYLVNNSVDLITKVVRVKQINNKRIIIIKNGIYSGLLDILLYKRKFKIYININNELILLNYNNSFDSTKIYIYGGSCDSADYIGEFYIDNKYFNDIKNNSEVIIKEVGAYCEEFFMDYSLDINKCFREVNSNEI